MRDTDMAQTKDIETDFVHDVDKQFYYFHSIALKTVGSACLAQLATQKKGEEVEYEAVSVFGFWSRQSHTRLDLTRLNSERPKQRPIDDDFF